MKATLGKKFFIYTAILLVSVLLVTSFFLVRGASRQWEDYLHAQSLAFARFATPELLKQFRGDFPPRDSARLDAVYDFLGFNRDLVQFSLYSPSGRQLFASPLFPDYIDLVLGAEASSVDKQRLKLPRATTRTIHPAAGGRLLDLVAPAFGPTGEQLLAVRYLVSYDSVDRRLAEMRQIFIRIGFVAFVFSLILAALVARQIAKPVVALSDAARAIGRGELETRMHLQGSDEISALAASFNDMASNLSASRQALTEKNSALQKANDDLQQVQAQLIRSERLAAIGQLATGISHEIDNPVGIIHGYAELLLEDCAEDDPRVDDLRAIIEECRRCKKITGGLLGFARSGSGIREPVDLDLLCRETILSLSPQRLFREVVIDYRRPQYPLKVEGDGDQLRQIMMNLMLNAAQALDGQGTITIALQQQGKMALISVKDNGPGIDAALQDKIFEPFFSTKEREQGTGLGLSLCRKLAEDHGGDLSLDETCADGARLCLRLPL